MKRELARVALGLGLLAAGVAQAAVVTYTFGGSANGSLGGTSFTSQSFSITVTGDSATAQNGAFPYTNVLTGGSVTIAGTACASGCAISSPISFEVYNLGPGTFVHGISTVGHPQGFGQTLLEGCFSSSCGGTDVNDNLVTNVPLTASLEFGALAPYVAFATGGGSVQLTHLNSLNYGVAVTTPAIPTLSTWALIALAGLLALGGIGLLRRTRRPNRW